jgi:hypothetical protein
LVKVVETQASNRKKNIWEQATFQINDYYDGRSIIPILEEAKEELD